MEFLLFFLRKMPNLIEPPRLLISEKPATNTVFYVIDIKTPSNFMPYYHTAGSDTILSHTYLLVR